MLELRGRDMSRFSERHYFRPMKVHHTPTPSHLGGTHA